jgi:hypothetical protein
VNGDTPPAAIEAIRHKVAIAMHDAECADRHCSGTALGAYYGMADVALFVAAPLIAAAERERIRDELVTVVIDNAGSDGPFLAALLGALLDTVRELTP